MTYYNTYVSMAASLYVKVQNIRFGKTQQQTTERLYRAIEKYLITRQAGFVSSSVSLSHFSALLKS